MGPFELTNYESIKINILPASTEVWLQQRVAAGTTNTKHLLLVYTSDQWAHLNPYDFADQLDDALSELKRKEKAGAV